MSSVWMIEASLVTTKICILIQKNQYLSVFILRNKDYQNQCTFSKQFYSSCFHCLFASCVYCCWQGSIGRGLLSGWPTSSIFVFRIKFGLNQIDNWFKNESHLMCFDMARPTFMVLFDFCLRFWRCICYWNYKVKKYTKTPNLWHTLC